MSEILLSNRPLSRSHALVKAQKIADKLGMPVWVRETTPTKWLLSDTAVGYYNSTETEVVPR